MVASVLTGSQPQAQPGRRGTGTTLDNHFMVIPADRTWRPQPLPKPKVDGPQSAVVTGPEGEEIFCDEHGRVRVKFNWDRYNPADQHSSCWIRVAQAWAGAGFGNLAIPRVGQEVIVDFLNGDPDQPIITGRTYHADNRSPGSLPGTKTQMTIRSKTYMGSGFNELRFDDATNREQVYIHAQKNMDTEVLNNRTTDVKADHSETIGHDQRVTVAHDRQVTVRNDQTLNVRHDRRASVSHDDGLYVANDRTVTVEGNQAQTTRGNHVSRVEGRHSLEVQGDLAQKVAGALGVKVQGDIVLESSGRITLTAGNSFVVIHAGGVDISGPRINLNGGGSPGTPVGTLSPAVLKATAEEGDDTVLTWQKTPGTTSTEPLTNPWVEPATSSVNNQNLKPVIRLSDAPGINGLNQSSRPWQIVMADTYIQAVTTDEVLMKGQTDANGNVTPTEAQQQELAKLASQFQSQLWLIAGHRAHRLSFNMISSSASSEVQDNCAQDAMGFHSLFNKVTGHALPGEKFKQCILSEHATNGTMLKPLREEK